MRKHFIAINYNKIFGQGQQKYAVNMPGYW